MFRDARYYSDDPQFNSKSPISFLREFIEHWPFKVQTQNDEFVPDEALQQQAIALRCCYPHPGNISDYL